MRIAGWEVPYLHPEGYRPVAIAACVALVALVIFGGAGLIFAGFVVVACALFFRDCDRFTPDQEGLVVSPADGVVQSIEMATVPAELGLGAISRLRIAVFMSVFDAHVNRAPIHGRITKIAYQRGAFVSAAREKMSDQNERNSIALVSDQGASVIMVQIAGYIARRIVCYAGLGDTVLAGERVGFIRFGSRVDIYIDPDCAVLVSPGQQMIGGETVLADLKASRDRRQAECH